MTSHQVNLDISVKLLEADKRNQVCVKLNEPDKRGKDWRGLCSQLGYSSEDIDLISGTPNPADALLTAWVSESPDKCSVRILVASLRKLGRADIAEILDPRAAAHAPLQSMGSEKKLSH